MYKFFITAFLLGFCILCFAQYKPVANVAAFKAQFAAASAKTNSIASEFTQVKNLTMLSEKLTSKGKFYFKRQNLVRLEYTSPYKYLMVMNGSKINIQDGQKITSVSTKSNKMFQQLNQLMIETVNGNVFDNKNFTTRIFESADDYLIEMTPVTAQMKNVFAKVNVMMAKSSFIVNRVQLFEPGGDYTSIAYEGQKINSNLPDALFTVK